MLGDAGVVHPVHCLTLGQVAFRRGDRQLGFVDWREADSVEVLFRGHKADQLQQGAARMRTRDEVLGPRSGYRTSGVAVSLMVELISYYPTLPDYAPLSSYREGKQVKVIRYGKVTQTLREIVKKYGRDRKTRRVALVANRGSFHDGSWRRDFRSVCSVGRKVEVRGIQGLCGTHTTQTIRGMCRKFLGTGPEAFGNNRARGRCGVGRRDAPTGRGK